MNRSEALNTSLETHLFVRTGMVQSIGSYIGMDIIAATAAESKSLSQLYFYTKIVLPLTRKSGAPLS